MKAIDLLFPKPSRVVARAGRVPLPSSLAVTGERLPAWLRRRLRKAGVTLSAKARTELRLAIDPGELGRVADPALRSQAYVLRLGADGSAAVTAGGQAGLRHGVVTLALLMEAAAAGASLSPVTIFDAPAFDVRGVQVDMAREFYPPLRYLKRIIDRLVDLKLNTLWLYIENHFHAPGLEDISPRGGLTPEHAAEISAYGSERGVDVVPGTNLLSHMEGWFRLERYADFCDGRMRSHPVLTRPEALELACQYVDALIEAFPSPNFHAGLDELLFTGLNPEAADATARCGKPAYFGEFARKLVDYIQAKDKVVWWWDDMAVGKNVFRAEGFNEDAPKALAYIPEDTVMVHWWYWCNEGGRHAPILKRVAATGRRFVVAPSIVTFKHDYGSLNVAGNNQRYMARVGRQHGAFGYVCTHWESRYGNSFEACWPLMAMSAAQAWRGGCRVDDAFLRALSFTVAGETTGALGEYLRRVSAVDELISARTGKRHPFRGDLWLNGPAYLWRMCSPLLDGDDRDAIRAHLKAASEHRAALGGRDPKLADALRFPLSLWGECLNVIDAMDHAWAEYHRAAAIERQPGSRAEFRLRIRNACARIRQGARAIRCFRQQVLRIERTTGHTGYDAHVLSEHAANLAGVAGLIRACARDDAGLPYIEKLLHLPDAYHVSNLRRLQVQNTFHPFAPPAPWPVRRAGSGPAGTGQST